MKITERQFLKKKQKKNSASDLQVITHLLAVGDSLNFCWGAEVQSLTPIGEAKGSCYAHVCQRQVIYVHQRS